MKIDVCDDCNNILLNYVKEDKCSILSQLIIINLQLIINRKKIGRNEKCCGNHVR